MVEKLNGQVNICDCDGQWCQNSQKKHAWKLDNGEVLSVNKGEGQWRSYWSVTSICQILFCKNSKNA
jgi:hypothetical protein